jgi:hypothetical protein
MSSHHTIFHLVVLKRLKVKDQRTSFSIFFGGALGGGKQRACAEIKLMQTEMYFLADLFY